MQRKQYWWLPYVVLEFDKNEILVEALGGDLSKPEWNYRADLYVLHPFVSISCMSHNGRVLQRCVTYIQCLRLSLPAHCAVSQGARGHGQ